MAEEVEGKDPFEQFNEMMSAAMSKANDKISVESTRLMDIHHETIQHSREAIRELRTYMNRYEECIHNIIVAHSIAAKEIADLYSDVIVGELGIEEVEVEEDEDDGQS